MKHAEQLIGEALFYEINNQRWHKDLRDSLTEFVPEIEAAYIESLNYSHKYPGSPDAALRARSLARILDSVSGESRSMKILLRGEK